MEACEVIEGVVRSQDGSRTAYADYEGAGPGVIHFHGTGSSRLEGRLIAAAGLRTITFDRPGYGRSPTVGLLNFEGVAAAALAVADSLQLDRFHVSGFSGGAAFASHLAQIAPDRVLTTTLINMPADATASQWDKMPVHARLLHRLVLRPALFRALALQPILSDPERLSRGKNVPAADRAALAGNAGRHWGRMIVEGGRQGFPMLKDELRLLSRPWWPGMSHRLSLVHARSDLCAPFAAALSEDSSIPLSWINGGHASGLSLEAISLLQAIVHGGAGVRPS